MTNDKSISILNDVLETLLDSRDGYQKAAEVADRDVFKQFFTRRAAARNSMVTKTQAEIRHLGGEPAEEGTILAKAHRSVQTTITKKGINHGIWNFRTCHSGSGYLGIARGLGKRRIGGFKTAVDRAYRNSAGHRTDHLVFCRTQRLREGGLTS